MNKIFLRRWILTNWPLIEILINIDALHILIRKNREKSIVHNRLLYHDVNLRHTDLFLLTFKQISVSREFTSLFLFYSFLFREFHFFSFQFRTTVEKIRQARLSVALCKTCRCLCAKQRETTIFNRQWINNGETFAFFIRPSATTVPNFRWYIK